MTCKSAPFCPPDGCHRVDCCVDRPQWVGSIAAHRPTGWAISVNGPTAPLSPTRPSGEPNGYAHGDVDDTTAREEPSDDEIYNGHGMEGGIAYDTGRGDA